MIQQLGLQANVLFTGYAAANQLKWLYKNASIYTFPSVNEGFGIPVLEAFSYDLPVIVSEDDAVNEIAGNGALSVPSLDPQAWSEAMKKLINSSNLRDDLIKNGKLRLKEFSKKNFLEGIENFIFRDQ